MNPRNLTALTLLLGMFAISAANFQASAQNATPATILNSAPAADPTSPAPLPQPPGTGL